jgi:hypothetical protein
MQWTKTNCDDHTKQVWHTVVTFWLIRTSKSLQTSLAANVRWQKRFWRSAHTKRTGLTETAVGTGRPVMSAVGAHNFTPKNHNNKQTYTTRGTKSKRADKCGNRLEAGDVACKWIGRAASQHERLLQQRRPHRSAPWYLGVARLNTEP